MNRNGKSMVSSSCFSIELDKIIYYHFFISFLLLV